MGNSTEPDRSAGSKRDSTTDLERAALSVFADAVELAEEDRSEYVASACGGDPELLERVRSLLTSHDQADAYFARLGRLGGLGHEGQPLDLSGRSVGSYRLVELLGRGGMGAVYRAERATDDFEHTAAIKLLPIGMDFEEARRRFHSERRILARLSHPNIAQLFDGGVTDDGTPYFVLEFVNGSPLLDYCNRKKTPVRGRLTLFRQVCQAVAHAHQNLVVHRDLKPSNILVASDGPDGAVKLLDFGISRILDPDVERPAADPTRYFRVLTPGYASPEQIRGEPVATTSDVFSLGVVLHELLTGTLPYSADPTEATRQFSSGVPPRPAVRFASIGPTQITVAEERSTTPPQLDRLLRGDLAAIVMRAIDPNADRRYAAVADLDRDLARWLRSEPVLARVPTLAYRARKFVHRHRRGLVAASIVVAMAGALGATRVREARRVAAERERTALEAAKTAAFAEVIQSANPFGEGRRDATVEEALGWAAASLSDRDYTPEVDAAVRTAIGITLHNLAHYERAEELIRQGFQQRTTLLVPPHPDIAESLYWMGEVHRFQESDSAAWYHERALAMRRASLPPDAPDVIASLMALSDLLPVGTEDPPPVLAPSLMDVPPEVLLGEALRLEEGRDTASARLDEIELRLAGVAVERGDLATAKTYALAVLDRREVRYGERHPLTGEALHTLAELSVQDGDHEGAVALFRRVYQINRATLGSHESVGSVELSLGVSLAALQEDEEAETFLRRAVATYEGVLGPDDFWVGLALQHLGSLLVDRGDAGEAVPVLERGWRIYDRAYGSDHWASAGARGWYGFALAESGRTTEGRRQLTRAVEMLTTTLGAAHERTRAMRDRLERIDTP